MTSTAGRRLLALVTAGIAAGGVVGCASENEGGDRARLEIERLRALPYASGVADLDDRDLVTIHDLAHATPGDRLYVVQALSRADLIDELGATLHSWRLDPSALWEHAELLAGGDLLVIGADAPATSVSYPDSTRYVALLDSESRVRWKRRMNAHHDAASLSGDVVELLTFERQVVPGIHATVETRNDGITRLNARTGETLATVDFLGSVAGRERVFPRKPVSVSRDDDPWVDLFHSNALDRLVPGPGPKDDGWHSPSHVLVTFRNQDRVALFDPSRRAVVWSWGAEDLDGPHDGQVLPNGNVLIFDNGLRRGWSRVVELEPLERRIVWEWEAAPRESFYSASKGSVQRLPAGSHLLAESDRGRVIEVAADGRIVWEFLCPYRLPGGERAAVVRMKWLAEVPEFRRNDGALQI
jgi:hypothetical protein